MLGLECCVLPSRAVLYVNSVEAVPETNERVIMRHSAGCLRDSRPDATSVLGSVTDRREVRRQRWVCKSPNVNPG